MRIPRHWASAAGRAESPRGRAASLTCFGWSDVSLVEAQRRAADAVARLSARVRAGEPFPAPYAYASRPLRDEIVHVAPDGAAEPSVMVTRNAYGALILNTARVMFVDVDEVPSMWARLRHRVAQWRAPGLTGPKLPERLTSFLATHPRWRVRVYRTRAGWRYLIAHEAFEPTGAHSRAVLENLGCDPCYVHLTRVQECFRARLTPKPWRCGSRLPPGHHPREDAATQDRYARWQSAYVSACEAFATCELVAELGSGATMEEAGRIIELHDRETRATSGLPLA